MRKISKDFAQRHPQEIIFLKNCQKETSSRQKFTYVRLANVDSDQEVDDTIIDLTFQRTPEEVTTRQISRGDIVLADNRRARIPKEDDRLFVPYSLFPQSFFNTLRSTVFMLLWKTCSKNRNKSLDNQCVATSCGSKFIFIIYSIT